jgi:hypothetical protein
MRFVLNFLATGLLFATGCSGLFPNKRPQAQNPPEPLPSFSMISSTDGTFLLDQSHGKVWRYDSKQGAFIEVTVASKDFFAQFGGKAITNPSQ